MARANHGLSGAGVQHRQGRGYGDPELDRLNAADDEQQEVAEC
jgi:hypothetical protein